MTDRELRKLSRAELLEMLLIQTEEVERLREEVIELQAKLADRDIHFKQAGNIAEAALRVNSVFQAAQSAADQYLKNIEKMEAKAREDCIAMKKQTQLECSQMIRNAEIESSMFWEEIREKVKDPYQEHQWWYELMQILDDHTVDNSQGEVNEG